MFYLFLFFLALNENIFRTFLNFRAHKYVRIRQYVLCTNSGIYQQRIDGVRGARIISIWPDNVMEKIPNDKLFFYFFFRVSTNCCRIPAHRAAAVVPPRPSTARRSRILLRATIRVDVSPSLRAAVLGSCFERRADIFRSSAVFARARARTRFACTKNRVFLYGNC